MKARPHEIALAEVHREQLRHVAMPEFCKLREQIFQSFPLAIIELRLAVEVRERARVAGKDVPGARDPVGALAVDEVPDDVVGRPRALAFRRPSPPVGYAIQECSESGWRPSEDRHRLVQLQICARHLIALLNNLHPYSRASACSQISRTTSPAGTLLAMAADCPAHTCIRW